MPGRPARFATAENHLHRRVVGAADGSVSETRHAPMPHASRMSDRLKAMV